MAAMYVFELVLHESRFDARLSIFFAKLRVYGRLARVY